MGCTEPCQQQRAGTDTVARRCRRAMAKCALRHGVGTAACLVRAKGSTR